MLSKTISFIEDQFKQLASKPDNKKDEYLQKLFEEKKEYVRLLLFELTAFINALTDNYDPYFKNRLEKSLESLKRPDDSLNKNLKGNKSMSWKTREKLYIYCLNEFLSTKYEVPSDNLIRLQLHMETLWIFYSFLIFKANNFSFEICSRIDFVMAQVTGVTKIALAGIKHYGDARDKGVDREKGSKQRGLSNYINILNAFNTVTGKNNKSNTELFKEINVIAAPRRKGREKGKLFTRNAIVKHLREGGIERFQKLKF